MISELREQVDRDGFAVLSGAIGRDEVEAILTELDNTLRHASAANESVLGRGAKIYAARNLLRVWPAALELARKPAIRKAVTEILGPRAGLVRGLFFDKPPGRSWSLPWHKDMTIAVRDNRLPSQHFSKPTTKAGVPHVEAPQWLLEQMLTARIHLNDVTDENGPLLVVPGSHRTGKEMASAAASEPAIQAILLSAGDVLMMRPLLAHSSGNSREGTRRHRRIVHLEFAAVISLPDGYHWHEFRPLTEDATR